MMAKKFAEHQGLNLTEVNKEILKEWDANDVFHKSIEEREGCPSFVFFEGPPSANGLPGIHHVLARTIKDIFCRYKTMKGYQVHRKAGWDTHGLPVELGVEKELGITKVDIGKSISIEEYNQRCRKNVMKFTKEWTDLTHKMGYWVDLDNPYITYDNKYMETLWWLLKQFYNKGLLYKGYTIQPYSPAAGTGLSSHELNQPGCYRDVKDTTVTAQFLMKNPKPEMTEWGTPYFIAWTTTPWTLPSNTALCVGPKIDYVAIQTYNMYTAQPITVVMAKERVSAYFDAKGENAPMDGYKHGDKVIPYKIVGEYKGTDLVGMEYQQLMPYVNPGEGAFRVIPGDYVTTEDGTGIVHIAPTFGADDANVARKAGIPALQLISKKGERRPMVDLDGKFYKINELDADFVKNSMNVDEYKKYEGRYVKNAYDDTLSDKDETLDISICMEMKQNNQAFKIEKHVHNYPHCWRRDKPVLYYPLDRWFIRSTACKERMVELNKTINWKPESTGTGRFGKWLENLNDWNLSRSRFWGTPLPIWRTEDSSEEKCIGSAAELFEELEKSCKAGFMKENPLKANGFDPKNMSKENYEKIDLHRPYVDNFILVSPSGKKMMRETDLIDVWFDSGSMPYAQEGLAKLGKPEFGQTADFIAEGVDQTRGWFFTLHAINTMVSDKVAYKTVVSNGLVLDKNGNKMSKRLGNAVDPFKALDQYGADSLRWYMLTNAQPWDNLKFDESGVDEVRRKFFGTLYNTYSFFALYANVDGFCDFKNQIPVGKRQEIDRWIISLMNSLIRDVRKCYEDYDVTSAGRLIQDFVCDHLSNWYVRLNRKRFWGGVMDDDKRAAYQTLYSALETVAVLAAPIAPFFMERLFCDLNDVSQLHKEESVHFVMMPEYDSILIDKDLEERMDLAQVVSSMVLALRRKVNIKVRQPLAKMIIPVLDPHLEEQFERVKSLVLSEVNVKEVEFIKDTTGLITKKIKPNFKTLGKRYGKQMKEISAAFGSISQQDIAAIEDSGARGVPFVMVLPSGEVSLEGADYEITSEDMPGWLVASEGKLTVALDITISDELEREGIARELINRIQNLRKDCNFEVTDKINVKIENLPEVAQSLDMFLNYVCSQTLSLSTELVSSLKDGRDVEWINDGTIKILTDKV